MANIIEKKNRVRELINQSSFCKLLGVQEKLLHNMANLPDEANEEEESALDALHKVVELPENDSDMRETIAIFLRLDEIKARRDRDPNASIDDLLVPIN